RMDRPLLEHVSGGQVASQLDARYALWDEASGRWVFHDGVERDFSGLKAREEPFSSRVSDLAVPPRRLIPRERNPDEMSLRELLAYSRGVRRLGLPTLHLSVAAHRKLSYPFANLIICALGIPVALRLGRAGKPVAFFTALSVSFLYLWVIELSCALGDGGVLPPAVAAWAPNLFFGACAALLLSRFQD
ncbi:MAG: LptF/LptG family permease, partial [Elusimicrobia bacterium]|nr:LptF/LptG family permease [Elusimicrobiota bacterium]